MHCLRKLVWLLSSFWPCPSQILLHHLHSKLSVIGPALAWFESYLTNRNQRVAIAGTPSNPQPLSCGVPQCSVMGPILFSIYTTPRVIVRSHYTKFHRYADDTQLYLACECPDNDLDCAQTIAHLEACITDIHWWMPLIEWQQNRISQIPLQTPIPTIQIGDNKIKTSATARNLGVIFNTTLSFKPHIASVTKAAFFHLCHISQIHQFLTSKATKTLGHSLISSMLTTVIVPWLAYQQSISKDYSAFKMLLLSWLQNVWKLTTLHHT